MACALTIGLVFTARPRQQWERQLQPLMNASFAPSTASQCANCHAAITEPFVQTGHARSIWRGDDPHVVARFADHEYRLTPDGPVYRYVADSDGLWLTKDGSPLRLRADWILGSGTRSHGAIHLATNPYGATELCEHWLAWYPSHGVAPAIGKEAKTIAPHGIASLGEWLKQADAKECLGCHSTYVPLDQAGEVQTSQMIGGVGCARCHPDAGKHVAENGAVSAFRERWSELSPQEVIHRCGECHRRAEELNPEELNSKLLHIVRFAPVGLSQSRCFQGQDALKIRLDCTSCHDVHRPMPKDTNVYRKVCLSCHYEDKAFNRPCKAQPESSNCIECHMPLIATTPYLNFTDHWIRVRDH